MVSGALGVDQKGEGGLGFLQPHLRPVGRAERNRNHVSAGGLNLCVMCHNLCHVVTAGQSGKVAQEDEQRGTAVFPKS